MITCYTKLARGGVCEVWGGGGGGGGAAGSVTTGRVGYVWGRQLQ